MNDPSSWIQSNWYALANLLIQLAFLAAGVWFARHILRTMRAFQEQVGALLKISMTGVTGERTLSSASAKGSLAGASPYWLTPAETQTISLPEPTTSGPSRFAVAWRKVVLWLEAPMGSAEGAPWRRIITWLQTPTGS
jgi:hypothetical protein